MGGDRERKRKRERHKVHLELCAKMLSRTEEIKKIDQRLLAPA